MEAQGSVLTNKYAEGYPGKRWYGGCENVDVVEQLAIDRAKELFGAEHANVQPHSGSQANTAVYFSVLQPGDKILTMDLAHGGHLTHGHKANFSGRFYEVTHYGVSPDDERIDYDELEQTAARAASPALITVGASRLSAHHRFRTHGPSSPARSAPICLWTWRTSPASSPRACIRARCRTPISSPPPPTSPCAARAAASSCARRSLPKKSTRRSSPASRADR